MLSVPRVCISEKRDEAVVAGRAGNVTDELTPRRRFLVLR